MGRTVSPKRCVEVLTSNNSEYDLIVNSNFTDSIKLRWVIRVGSNMTGVFYNWKIWTQGLQKRSCQDTPGNTK